VELGGNQPLEGEAVELVPKRVAGGSEPRMILESRTRKGMYLGWKGKLPETGDKLSIGMLDIKAIRAKHKRADSGCYS
jgi:hypothetical protein